MRAKRYLIGHREAPSIENERKYMECKEAESAGCIQNRTT
jgi:hypothetical protein